MNQSQVVTLLSELGCKRVQVKSSGWVLASCPLAKWEHEKQTDAHPSFGVELVSQGASRVNCFSCGFRGTVSTLIWKYEKLSGKRLNGRALKASTEAVDVLTTIARVRTGLKKMEPVKAILGGIELLSHHDQDPDTIWPESELDYFSELPEKLVSYLTGARKLTLETIKKFELRWHPDTERLAIPVRDLHGHLVGISGRSMKDNAYLKFQHTRGFHRNRYLYGEQFLKPQSRIVIVEGFFDAMKLTQYGYSSVALMGTHLSRVQTEKLVKYARSVVCMGDGDKAGRKAGKEWFAALNCRASTSLVEIGETLDPDDLSEEEASFWLDDVWRSE